MDTVKQLLSLVIRSFYDEKQVIIYDMLLSHAPLVFAAFVAHLDTA
jgi:hypothetical protein